MYFRKIHLYYSLAYHTHIFFDLNYIVPTKTNFSFFTIWLLKFSISRNTISSHKCISVKKIRCVQHLLETYVFVNIFINMHASFIDTEYNRECTVFRYKAFLDIHGHNACCGKLCIWKENFIRK